jgi:F-type H+-transporting ATPase subunit b
MLLSFGRFCLTACAAFLLVTSLSLSAQADEPVGDQTQAAAQVDSSENADASHDEAGHDGSEHGNEHAGEDHSGSSHGESHELPPLLQIDFGSAVINLLIFSGVFLVLSKFVWPPILAGLQARETKIHDDLTAAEQANNDAKNLLGEYQSKLDEAANQVQEMLASARRDAESAGQRIVDEAKEEAVRQRERAVSEIETAKKVAISELAGQTSDMAIQVAKQVVGRELKAEDHADLIRQSLERLPSNN